MTEREASHKSRHKSRSSKDKKKEKVRSQKDEVQKLLEPYLLGGEQIVHTAKVARRQIIKGILTALPDDQGDIPGVLLITNCRLIFLSNRTLQSETFLTFFKDKRKSQRTQWTEVPFLAPSCTVITIINPAHLSLKVFRLLS